MNDFISDIITEAALDSRIENGMIDLKNADHIQVIAEAMYDACGEEDVVNEFIDKFMEEGKYPDRQAFNKEGWLVTFPSKEYRDKAIKKGTHSVSDPTHGKGGMNLYYKRKGKQKRQTQQATTQVQPEQPDTQTPKAQKATTPQASGAKPSMDSKRAERLAKITGKAPETIPASAESPATEPKAEPTPTSAEKQSATTSTPDIKSAEAPTPAEMPAIDVPVATTPPVEYANISKKFAQQKGWKAEPYGAYIDAEGNTVAVVGLTGEVVPIKSNDREEYELFAEKNMP